MKLKACLYPHRVAYLSVMKRRVDWFHARAARCREIQREVLFRKLRRHADSGFGRDHGFSEISSIDEFRRRVPVAGYEYYRPYAERVKRGEIGAMFGPETQVLMFSMTSGTTSEPKFIPVTREFFKEYRESWNLWGLGVYRDHPDLLLKQTLQFTSDWRQFQTPGGIHCGNISGLAAETRPWIAKPMFILPVELNKVSGAANKQYVALRLALPSKSVGMIGTANPLTLVNLARLADRRRESLIRDLFDGVLASDVETPPLVREALSRDLSRRHPGRARELERIVERTGHLHPRDFWPNLSVLAVWTGGSVGVYLPTVKEYYGDVVFRDHGLSASEGRMTTPFEDNCSAGVLDYVTHYFEFIPEQEHDSEKPTVLEAHELEEGRSYYLLMTTSSGFYRYDIHDVVRCVGFVGACPKLEFLNKGAHFSSMAGEKLSEFQVVRAIQAALQDVGLRVEHFTLAPLPGDPPRYRLLLDAELAPDVEERLARRADRRLSEMNFEYEDRLATHRLQPLVVQRIPPGAFDRYRDRFLQQDGASSEQYKHPFLTAKTDFLDRLLAPAPGEAGRP